MNIPKIHSKIDSAAAQAKKGATAVNDRTKELGQALERAAEQGVHGTEAAASKAAEAIETAVHNATESAKELAKKAKQAVHEATDE